MKANKYSQIVLIGLAVIFVSSLHAQQQVQYTQYMYNTMSVNPAYTGTSNRLEAYLIHRSQWVGMSGAPNSQNIGVQGAVSNRIGLGFNAIKDRLGPANEVYLNASAAVRLNLSSKVKLSIGINGGVDVLSVDWSSGQVMHENDQSLMNNIRSRVRPLVGAGLYLYGNNWYAGISSPSFMKADRYTSSITAPINSVIHWYFIGGYVFTLSDQLKFKPAILGKLVQGAPLSLDISANFLLQERFTMGAAYRFNDAFSVLAGITFKKSFFLGYSYDFSVTRLQKFNNGSHDIIFRYTLFDKIQNIRSPRFF